MAARIESAKEAVPGSTLLVVHEFVARSPDELSLSKGDRIELIERDDDFGDGWYLGRHLQTGSTGLFPEVYTTVAPKTTLPKTFATTSSQPTTTAHLPVTAANAASIGVIPTQSLDSVVHSTEQPIPVAAPLPSAQKSASTSYQQTPPTQPGAVDPTTSNRSSHNSAVMNETLSVIDEHITGMKSPPGGSRGARLHSSQSNRDDHRLSYIAGSETEEEEESHRVTEAEVQKWSPEKVAEYLADVGVEQKHCDVFREQEFSGEVLLTMEQSTVFLKELDLGPIGRRLKTWGKIKALQDEVKARAQAPSKSKHASESGQSPLGIISGAGSQYGMRPSAASVRSYNQSRRTSSNDPGLSPELSKATHNKFPSQQSLDKGWTMSSANRSTSALNDTRSNHFQTMSADRSLLDHSAHESQVTLSTSMNDPDRGYASGGEIDSVSKARKLLRKKPTPDHSRQPSQESSKRRLSFFGKKSPMPSSPDPSRDHPIAGTTTPVESTNGQRIVSEPMMDSNGPPMVTKLEYGNESPRTESTSNDARKSWRVTSDAVTGREKAMHRMAVDHIQSSEQGQASPRSSTPSAISYEDAAQSKLPTQGMLPITAGSRRKNKKDTSAYILGLEKKSPQEQMVDAEFSGWMKKKSSNLMTNWKPRLFVLKGRRLSYYYNENDTEEKGLIDISGHRVLSADNERITGLHASLTGAKSSPTSPSAGSSLSPSTLTQSPINMVSPTDSDGTMSALPAAPQPTKDSTHGFIFKLVPPRTGMSRAVNFTKPAVHYFAVSTLEEGRLWMAALMKATIDRDESVDVVTTYQQKTISLAKARARKERPPALKNLDEENQAVGGQPEVDVPVPEPTSAADVPERFTAQSPSMDSSGQRDQVTPVTDLETSFSRTRTNSSARNRFMSRDSKSVRSTSTSNDGLGIEVQGNSPILSRMQQSGLW